MLNHRVDAFVPHQTGNTLEKLTLRVEEDAGKEVLSPTTGRILN